MTAAPRVRLAQRIAGLYAIVDDDPRWPRDPLEQARSVLRAGVRVLQLRVKHATDAEALRLAETIRALATARDVLFLVNDRFDLALASGADGVHLGQEDLPPARIPDSARARLCIGRSTHSLEQVEAALSEPIDYLAFGPVFATHSKAGAQAPRGLEALARVARRVRGNLPLVAIGGIDAERAPDALRAGAQAVAVISALAGSDDPEATARMLMQRLRGAREA